MIKDKIFASKPNPMDYEQLRAFGLDHIQKIGAEHWTDFNVHDPGVTILEALCLSLADLSFRSSANMADLLTRKGFSTPSMEGGMIPAEKVFIQEATTFEDYRKLILENVPGVRNIWFNPCTRRFVTPSIPKKIESQNISVNGFYNVKVELESEETLLTDKFIQNLVGGYTSDIPEDQRQKDWEDTYKEKFISYIRRLLLRHRNHCEMVEDISILDSQEIGICATIELGSDTNISRIIQEIYDVVYDYVCPTIQFHSIEDLLAKGENPIDIVGAQTPLLGFIDRQELADFGKRTDLYASDIIGLLMKIDGIKSIKHFHFAAPKGNNIVINDSKTHIKLGQDKSFTLSFCPRFMTMDTLPDGALLNSIIFSKNGLTFYPSKGTDIKKKEDERLRNDNISKVFPLPKGTYRNTDRYFSFQNFFPNAYRMGVDTLPESASNLRKAERLQLKAYLTLFDQLLADYLCQVDSYLDLLSLSESTRKDNGDVYFHAVLNDSDIEDVSKVLSKDYPNTIPAEDVDDSIKRKNNILDHLLSRFADSFTDYTVLEFIKSDQENFTLREAVEDKKRFLSDYPTVSAYRSTAMDLTSTLGTSGAERRILRKIGVNVIENNAHLSEGKNFGLHIIEHNLLLPRKKVVSRFAGRFVTRLRYQPMDPFLKLAIEEGKPELTPNPYSFRVTVLLPGWSKLGLNKFFRSYVENVIREELPAHLSIKTCWISQDVMKAYEDGISSYLKFMNNNPYYPGESSWIEDHDAIIKNLVNIFDTFENVYPYATLQEDTILDYTNEDVSRFDFTYLGADGKDNDDDIDVNDLPFVKGGHSGIKEIDLKKKPAPISTPSSFRSYSSGYSSANTSSGSTILTPGSSSSSGYASNNGDNLFPGSSIMFEENEDNTEKKASQSSKYTSTAGSYCSKSKVNKSSASSNSSSGSNDNSFPGANIILNDNEEETEKKTSQSSKYTSASSSFSSKSKINESSASSNSGSGSNDNSFPGANIILEEDNSSSKSSSTKSKTKNLKTSTVSKSTRAKTTRSTKKK